MNLLFDDLEIITSLNEQFFPLIEGLQKSWHPYLPVGNSISTFIKPFSMYATFVQNYDQKYDFYMNLLTKPKSKKVLNKIRQTETNPKFYDLPDILIQPVQRLPRYHILFQELLKKTPPDHQDYNELGAVVKGFDELTQEVNEKRRTFENKFRLWEISIENCTNEELVLVDPKVSLLMEQNVIVEDGLQQTNYTTFLLNTFLVFTTPISEKRFNYVSSFSTECINANRGIKPNEALVRIAHSYAFTMVFGTEKEAETWLEILKTIKTTKFQTLKRQQSNKTIEIKKEKSIESYMDSNSALEILKNNFVMQKYYASKLLSGDDLSAFLENCNICLDILAGDAESIVFSDSPKGDDNVEKDSSES